jgi:putative flippase GtrA
LYQACGALTTLVNIIAYFSLNELGGIQYLASNVMAWSISVLFAYVTNRIFVFTSQGKGLVSIIRECLKFIGCRLFSGLVDTTTMYMMIDLLHFNDLLVKVIANIIVIILNYGLSKEVVFQDKGQGEVILCRKYQ